MWTKIKNDPFGAYMMAFAASFCALGTVASAWAMWRGFADIFNGQVPSPVQQLEAAVPLMLAGGIVIGSIAGYAYRGWQNGEKGIPDRS
jgi:hypothetical protein